MVPGFKFGFGGDDIDEEISDGEIEHAVRNSPELSQGKDSQRNEKLNAKSAPLDTLVRTVLSFLPFLSLLPFLKILCPTALGPFVGHSFAQPVFCQGVCSTFG